MSVVVRRRAGTIVAPPPVSGGSVGGAVPVGLAASGANTTFTPAVVSINAAEIQNPTRGLFDWNGADQNIMAPLPIQPDPDIYDRDAIYWRNLEPSQGSYNLTYLDQRANTAKARGGRYGFRVMTLGVGNVVPDYIQNNQGTYGGFGSGSGYAPDYNNGNFLNRIDALMVAIGTRFGTDPRFGMNDIGFYGMYGEWHLYGAPYGTPAISTASGIRIVDSCVNRCPNWDWVQMYGNPSVSDIVHYSMGKVSTAGKYVGWRNDAGGHSSQGDAQVNSACWNQTPNPQSTQWQRAPVVMEIANIGPDGSTYDSASGGSASWANVYNQVGTYHYSMISNGNTTASYSSFAGYQQADWQNSGKHSGYRLELRNATLPVTIENGSHFTLTTNWLNSGVAPAYRTWNVTYQLKNGTGTVVWTGTSTAALKGLLPSGTPTATSENFNLPTGTATGAMQLSVRVVDPTGYFPPLHLATGSRQSDGSYSLGSVTVA